MSLVLGERKVTKLVIDLAKGSSMVVEHLPRHPKVEGLSAATAADTGRDKIGEKPQQLKPMNEWW
jgi:hypothetical protein